MKISDADKIMIGASEVSKAYLGSAAVWSAGSSYGQEALDYQTRVLADGGIIISMADVDSAIQNAKANNYWADVVVWMSATFGVKKDESGNVAKLYGLKGNDASQAVAGNQPLWVANQKNGRAVIRFDGVDDYFTHAYPLGAATDFGLYLATQAALKDNGVWISPNIPAYWGAYTLYNFASGALEGGVGTNTDKTADGYISDSVWYVLSLYKDGTGANNLKLLKNNGNLTNNAGAEIAPSVWTMALGGHGVAGTSMSGDIAEYLVLSASPAGDINTAIQAFLNAKWAIY